MSQIQIAMSGVTAGKYGNSKQIPTFTVDARGRMTWAADLDIETALTVNVGNNKKSLNLNVDTLNFKNSNTVEFTQTDDGISAHVTPNVIELIQDRLNRGTFEGTFNGLVVANDLNFTGSIHNNLIALEGNTITSRAYVWGGGTRSSSPICLGTESIPATLYITSEKNFGIFTGLGDNLDPASIRCNVSRGTLTAPTISEPGDWTAFVEGAAYNGTDYATVGGFGLYSDSSWSGTVAPGSTIPGTFGVMVSNETGDRIQFSFNSKGVLTAPVIQPGSYTTLQRDALSPAVGMMIYNTTDNKFQGYQNTGGVTPQWVDLS
jgi:hypothetical protein